MADIQETARLRPERVVYFLAAIAALNGLLFGYDTGVISGALLFLKPEFGLSALDQEILTSGALAGAALGAGISGRLADRFGRRRIIVFVACAFLVGTLGAAFAHNTSWILIGRIIVGIAIGISSYTGPLYIAEIAPAKTRGALVSFNQFAITLGILLSYVADFLLADGGHWRWMFGIAVFPAIGLGLGMIFLPETPRWLVDHGRRDQARKVFERIRGNPIEIEEELQRIDSLQSHGGARWTELLTPIYRRALIVGIGLAIFQQITGINTIIYYAPTIFQLAGFSSAARSILVTAGVGIVNVVFTVISMWLLDRAGRRPLLLTGIGGMIVSLAAVGLVFHFASHSPSMGLLAAISVMVYVASFAISLGPIFWLLISEIYPVRVRGFAMGIATMANWGFNLLVALTFLTLIERLGPALTFFTYAGASVASWLFSFYLVPETRGRTLEEITAGEELHG